MIVANMNCLPPKTVLLVMCFGSIKCSSRVIPRVGICLCRGTANYDAVEAILVISGVIEIVA